VSTPALQHYLRHHLRYEWALCLTLFAANWAANTAIVVMDGERLEQGIALWRAATWEGSSTLLMLALLPALLWFDHHFPLRRSTMPGNLLAHLAATIPWSIVHVAGMVAIRKLVYAFAGEHYEFGSPSREFGYEYLKDFRSYFTVLSVVYLYRFVLLRLQGEASFPGEERESEEEAQPVPVTDRFLVKKLGREFLVRVDDIEWIEAAGNYVNLHPGARLHPLKKDHAEHRSFPASPGRERGRGAGS